MYKISYSCGEGPGGCGSGVRGKRTEMAALRYRRDDILYDISNLAYVEGEVIGEEQQHSHHTVVDICESGNRDRVLRVLDVVHAGVIEMLYPYTKEELREFEVVFNCPRDPEEYVVVLELPDGVSRTTLHLLAKLVHEYMVYMVLYDWLSMAWPQKAESWMIKAEMTKEKIRNIINTRRGRTRLRMHPF